MFWCLPMCRAEMGPIRVVATSDTHGEHENLHVPHGDILIHAGDLALRNNWQHLLSSLDWFARQPHPCKILVGGNHDHSLDSRCCFSPSDSRQYELLRKKLSAHVKNGAFLYLEHQTANVKVREQNMKVFGSPFTLEHGFGAWRYARHEDIWSASIPADTDVVIVHGPPFGVLDRNRRRQQCGCKHLLRCLQHVQPKLVVFGHIHEDFGLQTHTWPNGKTTTFANVAVGFPGQFPNRSSAVVLDLA